MTHESPMVPSLLAREFTQRLERLGLSRRELVKRTGLSRQTIHNIEREGRIDLRPQTLAAIDSGLYWRPGTALALSHGDSSVMETADAITQIDHESATRWRIVERVSSMSVDELDRLVAMMDGQTSDEHPNVFTPDEMIDRIERLEHLIESDRRHAS